MAKEMREFCDSGPMPFETDDDKVQYIKALADKVVVSDYYIGPCDNGVILITSTRSDEFPTWHALAEQLEKELDQFSQTC